MKWLCPKSLLSERLALLSQQGEALLEAETRGLELGRIRVMARTISLSVPHELSPPEVKRRLVEAIADARGKHQALFKDVQETWASENQLDFNARAAGQTITGSVRIEPQQVHLTVDLPMLLAMFVPNLKPRIDAEARKLLQK